MRKLIFYIILLTSLSASIAFSYEVTVYTYQNKIVYNNVKRIEPLYMDGGSISGGIITGNEYRIGIEAYRIIFKEEYIFSHYYYYPKEGVKSKNYIEKMTKVMETLEAHKQYIKEKYHGKSKKTSYRYNRSSFLFDKQLELVYYVGILESIEISANCQFIVNTPSTVYSVNWDNRIGNIEDLLEDLLEDLE